MGVLNRQENNQNNAPPNGGTTETVERAQIVLLLFFLHLYPCFIYRPRHQHQPPPWSSDPILWVCWGAAEQLHSTAVQEYLLLPLAGPHFGFVTVNPLPFSIINKHSTVIKQPLFKGDLREFISWLNNVR